jgi:hypothetical protein
MSRFEGPQGIVTNGLVLNLDAGDPDSYTRSQPPYVEVLVVAGGGGTGFDVGGGGGAGGVIYNSAYQITNAAAITVTIGAGGGSGQTLTVRGTNGNNSVFGSLTAIGGGGGGAYNSAATAPGLDGGSGGGGGNYQSAAGGNGTPGQGFNGGSSAAGTWGSGAGGGAGGPGANGIANQTVAGGAYATYAISGQSANYAGGGFGAFDSQTLRPSGQDSNGNTLGTYGFGANGTGSPNNSPYSGNQGIVIVRYPGLPAATGGTITYLNGYTIHAFTSSGTFTPFLWNDVSGNGNNGTLINGIGFNSYQNGGGLIFDGTDDYIQTGATNLSANIGTINMWIKTGFTSTSGAPYYLIDTRDSTNVNNIALYYYNPQGGFVIYGGNIIMADSETFSSNTYLMVTLSYNFTTDNYAFYINGILGTSSTSGYSSSGTITKTTLGSRYNQASSEFFIGNIFVTQIYNRVLSSTEVTQNFNAQRARFGI